jgi:hypothetical protein
MNVYQNAVDALKECVKQSMESDVPSNTQGEIWRHYQGVKTIAEQLGRRDSVQSFLTEGKDLYDPDYNIQAAQPVDLNLGLDSGKDVITFS